MAEILTLQASTFVMSDPKNFDFVGSILIKMLKKVPLDNAIVRDYRKLISSGVRPMPIEHRKLIDECNKLKRGGKRKAKAAPSESVRVLKKTKKPTKKLRSPSPVFQEELEEQTVTEVQEDDILRNEEEDTIAISRPAPTDNIPKVSSAPTSSVPNSDIFGSIPKEPFLNLSTTP